MTRTIVILVNYNNTHDTQDCLRSLLECKPQPPRVVVVDNASKDKDLDEQFGFYPELKLICNQENIGFGKANNVGINWALEQEGCEFVYILNNDTVVRPDSLHLLEKELDTHPEAGAATPRIMVYDHPELIWYAGGDMNWKKAGPDVPNFMKVPASKEEIKSRNVSFASGCAMHIRTSLINDIGGFDDRFFMYEEDVELSLRILDSGCSIWYCSEAEILHKCQGSVRDTAVKVFDPLSPENPKLPFYTYHITKNRILNMMRHAKGVNALQVLVFFPLYWGIKCSRYLLKGRWDGLQQVFKGIRHAFAERKLYR